MASTCEFDKLENSLIKDALVLGIRDAKLRQDLLLDSDLTLDRAVEMALASERTINEMKEIDNRREEN